MTPPLATFTILAPRFIFSKACDNISPTKIAVWGLATCVLR